MKNENLTLRSLETDVAILQALVKDLGSQERELRDVTGRLDAISVTMGNNSTKQGK